MRQTPEPEAVDPLRCTGCQDYAPEEDNAPLGGALAMRELFGHTGHTGALTLGQRQGPDGRVYEGYFEQRLCGPEPAQLGPDDFHWSPEPEA